MRFGHLDTHDAELEELVDEGTGDAAVLVHVADERANLAVGELEDGVTKEALVFGERRQRGAGGLGLFSRHGTGMLTWAMARPRRSIAAVVPLLFALLGIAGDAQQPQQQPPPPQPQPDVPQQ